MAKESVLAGTTSHSVNIFIQDSSSTIGAGLSGLVFNTSGLAASYSFTGANATATDITLATLAAVNSAFSSGGFKEINSTKQKGGYRLDIPNAALAAGNGQTVTFELHGATNMAPCWFEIELTAWNNQDGVHGGMTALPNAAAGAASGLAIVGSVMGDSAGVGTLLSRLSATRAGYLDNLSAGAVAQASVVGTPAGASIAADIAAISTTIGTAGAGLTSVAVTSNIKKNQALAHFSFLMTDSTNHAPATGLTVTVKRKIDGGAFAAGTLSGVTETSDGVYECDFAAGDLNGKVITLMASAVGADVTFERIVTVP